MSILQRKNNADFVSIYALLVISTGLGVISLGGVGGGNVRLWEALLAAFVLLSYLKNCLETRIVLMISLPLLLIMGYFTATLLSGVNAINTGLWLQRVALVLAMSLLFFVFSQRSTLRELALCFKLIVYSGVFFALLGIVDVYIFLAAPELYRVIHYFDMGRQFVDKSNIDLAVAFDLIPRARGFFTEPNEFSQYLILPFGFLLAAMFFRSQRTRWRVIYLIGILIVFLAQLFSLSRGGFLGFFGQFVGLYIIRNVSGIQWTLRMKNMLTTAIVLAALTIGASFYYGEEIMPLFDAAVYRVGSTGSRDDYSGEARLKTIGDGFVTAGASAGNFLVGVGAGNLNDSYVHEATTTNQFVDVLVETGIIGLGLYVAIILSLLWQSYKFMKNRLLTSNNELFVVFAGAYLSFLGMLLGGMTYSTHTLFFFWFNAGLLLAICKYGSKINKQEVVMQAIDEPGLHGIPSKECLS